jgi:hypothetical protein
MIPTTDMHITIHKLLEAVFSVQSVPRLHNKDQLPLRESLEMALRRVGGSCEMATSLQGHEPGNGGLSTVQRCYKQHSEDCD